MESPAEFIGIRISHLDALLSCAGHSRAGGSLDEALDEVLEDAMAASHGNGMAGRSTGFPSVDQAISGLEPGTFNVLGARPGMGKTALGCQIAVTIARQCKLEKAGGVLIFSLEMSKTAIARRVISEVSKLSVVDIKRGKIDGRVERLSSARHELKGLPLFIEDAGGQNVVAIKQKCRAAARRYKHLALILIDHIHIVKPDDADRRQGATQSVGKISNELRDISKDFDCPVLCLAQLNRGLFTREDKRPNLGDLRQAGDIEQDADIVMFLHREEVLLSKSPPERGQSETLQKHSERVSAWEDSRARCAGKAELIFEKVRDGAPCSVPLIFDHQTTSFSDWMV